MQDIAELHHVERTLSTGGKVFVLNTGAIIRPEAEAMIQALHSRSLGGLKEHLETLAKKGAEKFMASFYVGYGHKSIGDCGTATIFVEDVSMLAAKAIQDWALYRGQEGSTRYIDFANQPFINPIPTPSKAWNTTLELWRKFYVENLPLVVAGFRSRYPYKPEWDEKDYEKTINARAFDVIRGMLPAGASTKLSWHTDLRQAADHLEWMRHHPLVEVQEIAETIEDALREAFPSSFYHKRYEWTENYHSKWMQSNYYCDIRACPDFNYSSGGIDRDVVESLLPALAGRPEKTELPREVAFCGTMRFQFLLDFGSYRDIQRHRAVVQRMPLLTTHHGFERWYIDEMPEDVRNRALTLIEEQRTAVESLHLPDVTAQYFHPMGYRIPNVLVGDLRALVYLVELRNTRFVHPTLRRRARQMAEVLEKEFGKYKLDLHLDENPDAFDVKRGKQDIRLKE